MRPVYQTVTGVDVSVPIPVDQYIGSTAIAIACIISATATYTVEHTFDDVFDENFNPATATWFTTPGFDGPETTNQDGTIVSPPAAVRLNVSASTGDVQIVVRQAGAVS